MRLLKSMNAEGQSGQYRVNRENQGSVNTDIWIAVPLTSVKRNRKKKIFPGDLFLFRIFLFQISSFPDFTFPDLFFSRFFFSGFFLFLISYFPDFIFPDFFFSGNSNSPTNCLHADTADFGQVDLSQGGVGRIVLPEQGCQIQISKTRSFSQKIRS